MTKEMTKKDKALDLKCCMKNKRKWKKKIEINLYTKII